MLMNATAELFQRTCYNYPTLGDLYKYAAYDAVLRVRNEKSNIAAATECKERV